MACPECHTDSVGTAATDGVVDARAYKCGALQRLQDGEWVTVRKCYGPPPAPHVRRTVELVHPYDRWSKTDVQHACLIRDALGMYVYLEDEGTLLVFSGSRDELRNLMAALRAGTMRSAHWGEGGEGFATWLSILPRGPGPALDALARTIHVIRNGEPDSVRRLSWRLDPLLEWWLDNASNYRGGYSSDACEALQALRLPVHEPPVVDPLDDPFPVDPDPSSPEIRDWILKGWEPGNVVQLRLGAAHGT